MIQTIRKYVGIIVVALLLILGINTYIQYEKINSLRTELSVSKSNEKAFILENNGLKEENIAFKFTIEQLNYFNDSLTSKMNEVRQELKIKDRDLKQMQYLLSQAEKTDTVVFRDTLFIDKDVQIDSLLGDEWYTIRLGLQYPNLISISPSFKSEKFIIVSSKKETINPPKKCAIARLFQKKHRIMEVEVIEKSPYIENKQQRFIEIIE